MKNIVLERQPDGSYQVSNGPEPAAQAEMKQTLTTQDLRNIGLTDAQINTLSGIKSDKTAQMESSGFMGGIGSTLDKVTGMEIAGIPLGQAAVGRRPGNRPGPHRYCQTGPHQQMGVPGLTWAWPW